jgi:hypothetical protein
MPSLPQSCTFDRFESSFAFIARVVSTQSHEVESLITAGEPEQDEKAASRLRLLALSNVNPACDRTEDLPRPGAATRESELNCPYVAEVHSLGPKVLDEIKGRDFAE